MMMGRKWLILLSAMTSTNEQYINSIKKPSVSFISISF